MKDLKSALLKLAADNDAIHDLREHLGIQPTLEEIDVEDDAYLFRILKPEAVRGLPESVARFSEEGLVVAYWCEFRHSYRRATRDEPAEYDVEISSDELTVPLNYNEGLTAEEAVEIEKKLNYDMLEKIDSKVMEHMTNVLQEKSEERYHDDREQDYEYD